MRKISFLYLMVTFFAVALNEAAWADRSHYHSHNHHSHNSYSLGLGVGTGYGIGSFGYYGGHRSGFYGSYSFGYPYYPSYYKPYYYRPYYYGPYYGGFMSPPYYSSIVVVPATPPVYIQQPSTMQSSPPAETNYWHYCENPAGYYPYVKKCPGGWLKVPPQPIE